MKFSVIYDACVLYPAPLRDTLMRLAVTDLFNARWTDDIHEEWIRAVLRTGKHSKENLEYVRALMDENVRDAKVIGYDSLIPTIELPDPDDRHVVAAAIRCNADAIVTFNRKDFPASVLDQYAIDIIHPDDFICYQIDLNPPTVCEAIRKQRQALRNPPKNVDEFLITLQKQGLPQTVSILKQYAEFI